MKSEPPTEPANVTVPFAGARTGVPNGAAMSIPRWPDENGVGGGSNPRMTGPTIGHRHHPAGGEVAAFAVLECISHTATTASNVATIRVLLGATSAFPGTRRSARATLLEGQTDVCDPA